MNTRDHEPLTPEERDLAQRLSRLGGHAAPAASLDAKILAAARTAAAAPSPTAGARTRHRPRWPFGVGIAASLAVALGIAWQLRPQPEEAALRVLSEEAPAHGAMVVEVPKPAPPAQRAAADDAFDAAAAGNTRPAAAPAVAEPATPVRELSAPPPPAEPAPVVDAESAREAALLVDTAALKRAAAAEDTARRQRSEAVAFDAVPPPAPPPPPPAAAPAAATEPRGFVASPPPADAGVAAQATAIGTTAQTARERKADLQSSAAAADAGTTLDRIEVTGSRIGRYAVGEASVDQPLDDRPPASADAPEVRDAWLRRIRELRAAGQFDDARASLREFVRRHPDTAVPDDLRPLLDE